MTIQEIKTLIGSKLGITLGTLSMVRQFDQDPLDPTKTVASSWVSHWDNDHRVRVTMHEDIMAAIKADPTKADLAFKYEAVKPADKQAYHRFVIITPKDVEATF